MFPALIIGDTYHKEYTLTKRNLNVLVTQVATLFQSIGGLMGVYLGYSSLQIFHVADVLLDGAWLALTNFWNRRKRTRNVGKAYPGRLHGNVAGYIS